MVIPISTASEAKKRYRLFHHAGNGGQQETSVSTTSPDLRQSASRWRFVRAIIKELPLLKRAQQDDGTGGRQDRAQNDAALMTIPARRESAILQQRRHRYLSDSAGNGDDFTAIKSFSEKCSPTPNIINRITLRAPPAPAPVWYPQQNLG